MRKLVTVPTIIDGLSDLGVCDGATLLVHCSMSSFGHIEGGAQSVVEALIAAVGLSGTLVMPTLTHGRFDPSEWRNPPAPEEQWERIRFETPAFHPDKTPTDHTMSSVYELFRTWPGAVRTNHPHTSVAAWGKHRDRITQVHRLEERFGDSSPLGVLYELNAQVLFLGTNYATNTCFHLAEYRRPSPPMREFLIVQGDGDERRLVTYTDVDAECRLFSFRSAVDFAQDWLTGRSAS